VAVSLRTPITGKSESPLDVLLTMRDVDLSAGVLGRTPSRTCHLLVIFPPLLGLKQALHPWSILKSRFVTPILAVYPSPLSTSTSRQPVHTAHPCLSQTTLLRLSALSAVSVLTLTQTRMNDTTPQTCRNCAGQLLRPVGPSPIVIDPITLYF
jgi:hypothetical protein